MTTGFHLEAHSSRSDAVASLLHSKAAYQCVDWICEMVEVIDDNDGMNGFGPAIDCPSPLRCMVDISLISTR